MRIASIETFIAGHWPFVHVTTECGLTGGGESTYFAHPRAVAVAIEDLKSELLGQDPMQAEFHFQRLLKHHCIRDSLLMSALSTLDQAFWDIKGKALGAPVWQLLGGKVRERVRAILLIEALTEAEMFEKGKQAKREGFTALKIKPFIDNWSALPAALATKIVADRVLAFREELGWDIDIAVEVHRNLTPASAIDFAREILPARPYFVEDPIVPFSVASNIATAEAIHANVALAERNTNIWEFREFSDSHGVSILRPDAGLAGGFTQMKKIAAIAESRSQRIVPHNFTSPFITACHVQLAASTVNWDVQGYVRENRAPWTDVTTTINRIETGFLAIPDRPGIGMELNLDYLRGAAHEPMGSKFHHGAIRGMDGAVRHL
jgi:galactonate dehydratase